MGSRKLEKVEALYKEPAVALRDVRSFIAISLRACYNTNVRRINCIISVNLLQLLCSLLLNQPQMDDLFLAESWINWYRPEHSAKRMC